MNRGYAPFGTKGTENTQFSTLSSMCFDILSWDFVYNFNLMHFRLKSSIINFRQLLSELYPFSNIKT